MKGRLKGTGYEPKATCEDVKQECRRAAGFIYIVFLQTVHVDKPDKDAREKPSIQIRILV